MPERWIIWGQRAALAIAGVYVAILLFAGPLATVFPAWSEPARFLRADGTTLDPLRFAYGGEGLEGAFVFEAALSPGDHARLLARLGAPPRDAKDARCMSIPAAERPKFALPHQCARWEGQTLVIEQKLSAEDRAIRIRQDLSFEDGRLIWRYREQ